MAETEFRPTVLDRAIGIFSPKAMRTRIRERMLSETMVRGYNAAKPSRANGGWRRASSSADAEIGAAGPMLRDAMRDLVRNNPHAAKAVSSLVAYIVGDGIMPRASTGDPDLDKRINALWEEFAKKCDFDGIGDFYALQTLICREMIEGGEVLIRRRTKRMTRPGEVPVEFQVLESDMIDSSRDGPMPNEQGFAIQGVQFNSRGKKIGYWLWSTHPGNSHLDPNWTLESKLVPLRELAHVYERQRTQVRGVPWGTPVLESLRDLGDYEAAEIMRKKIEACAVGVVTGESDDPVGDVSATKPPGVYDKDGFLVERFEPGMFLYARGGRNITFHQPSTSGGYEAYKRSMLHTIAAGFRVPYSILSGDLSQNSYASQKFGMADFARLVKTTQWQILVQMACQPMWDWFIEYAYLAGLIPTDKVKAKWSPPPFPSGDPEKDIDADRKAIRSGLKTLDDVAQERGMTIDELIAEIKMVNEKLDAAEVVLDIDPRKVSQNGQSQNQPQGQAADQPTG